MTSAACTCGDDPRCACSECPDDRQTHGGNRETGAASVASAPVESAAACPRCEQPWSEHAQGIDGYSPKCLPAKPRLVSRVLTAPIWLLNFLVNGDE